MMGSSIIQLQIKEIFIANDRNFHHCNSVVQLQMTEFSAAVYEFRKKYKINHQLKMFPARKKEYATKFGSNDTFFPSFANWEFL